MFSKVTARNALKPSSPKKMEHLLLDWANLPETLQEFIDAERRLLRRYPEIFSGSARQATEMILSVQRHLRAAWDAPDSRVRDWYIFRVRQSYNTHLERQSRSSPIIHKEFAFEPKERFSFDLEQLKHYKEALLRDGAHVKVRIWNIPPGEPPPLTYFEQVMYHFHRIGHKAAHCKYPECPAPYFFRKKNNQQYDDKKCAAAAQREAKRRWWREHPRRKQKATG